MIALGKKFGVQGKRNHTFHLELGKKIYGDDPVFVYEELPELSIDELKVKVKEIKPTPQDWVQMKKREKQKFQLSGMGMIAIARKFGVEGNPFIRRKVFLELGKKIYGDDPVFEEQEEEL